MKKIIAVLVLCVVLLASSLLMSSYTYDSSTYVDYWNFTENNLSYLNDTPIPLTGGVVSNGKLNIQNNNNFLMTLPASSSLTLSMSVEVTSTSQSNSIIMMWSMYAANPGVYVTRSANSNTYTVTYRATGASSDSTSTFTLSGNSHVWTISYNYTARTVVIYADGVSVFNLSNIRMVNPRTRIMQGGTFRGTVDDILIVSEAWTAAQAAAWAAAPQLTDSVLTVNTYYDGPTGVLLGDTQQYEGLIGDLFPQITAPPQSGWSCVNPNSLIGNRFTQSTHTVNFIYSQSTVGYAVYYKDSDGNDISQPLYGQGAVGSTVQLNARSVSGYTPRIHSYSLGLSLGSVISYTFIYDAAAVTNATVTVHYVDIDTGQAVAADTVHTPVIGSRMTVVCEDVMGYEPTETYHHLHITSAVMEYTFYYMDLTVYAPYEWRFIDSEYAFDLVSPIIGYARIGTTVTQQPPEIDGYSGPTSSYTMTIRAGTNSYSYVYSIGVSYTVYCVDENGLELAEPLVYYVLSSTTQLTLTAPRIEGYRPLVSSYVYTVVDGGSYTFVYSVAHMTYVYFSHYCLQDEHPQLKLIPDVYIYGYEGDTWSYDHPEIPGYTPRATDPRDSGVFPDYSASTHWSDALQQYITVSSSGYGKPVYYDRDPNYYRQDPELVSTLGTIFSMGRQIMDIELNVYGYVFTFWDILIFTFVAGIAISILMIFIRRE